MSLSQIVSIPFRLPNDVRVTAPALTGAEPSQRLRNEPGDARMFELFRPVARREVAHLSLAMLAHPAERRARRGRRGLGVHRAEQYADVREELENVKLVVDVEGANAARHWVIRVHFHAKGGHGWMPQEATAEKIQVA